PNSNKFRQRQRFALTSALSTLINDVNGNRWRQNVFALPPFHSGALAKPSESCPHVGRGSQRRLSAYPLGRYQRRAGLPALPVRRYLQIRNPQELEMQILLASI